MATTEFADLLDELENLAKSMDNDEDDKYGDSDPEEGDDEDEEDDEDKDEDEKSMGKSFAVTLSDGTTVKAHDASALIDELRGQINAGNEAIARTVKTTTDLVKSLQGEIADLKKSLHEVSGRTAGRKSVLSVHERRPQTQPEEPRGLSARDLMTKALSAQRAGRLSGSEVAMIDAYIGRGQTPPGYLLDKVGQ